MTHDESAFTALVERHRRELQVHCYRMLGSFEEAEDLVQETFLRAWRARETFEGRSTFRAWLYRIATNACLDALERRKRVTPRRRRAARPTAPVAGAVPRPAARRGRGERRRPEAVVVAKETIELAFLAAIQHLPPRQRAVLILRDVLGWLGERDGGAARRQRRCGQQRPPAGARDAAAAAARAPARVAAPSAMRRPGSARCCSATSTRTSAPTREALRRCCSEDARFMMPPEPGLVRGPRDDLRVLDGGRLRLGRVRRHPVHRDRGQPAAGAWPTTCGCRAPRSSARWRSTWCGSRTAR